MKEIELSQGYKAMVDDEDYEELNKVNWHVRITKNTCYAVRNCNGTTVQMHRIIKDATKEFMVDHRNGNGLDNQKDNLRKCTRSQNLMNSRKPNKITTSQYKGVCYSKGEANRGAKKCWRAEIRLDRKATFLGYFTTEQEAALIYNEKASELYGEFAKLNEVIDE